jgi:hypothetical protein
MTRNRGIRQRSMVNRVCYVGQNAVVRSHGLPSLQAAHAAVYRTRVACVLPERCNLVLVRDQGRDVVGALLRRCSSPARASAKLTPSRRCSLPCQYGTLPVGNFGCQRLSRSA